MEWQWLFSHRPALADSDSRKTAASGWLAALQPSCLATAEAPPHRSQCPWSGQPLQSSETPETSQKGFGWYPAHL